MSTTTAQPANAAAAASEDFEKWIRMASDNKINTTNSWDLALIDYFYDLSLLREKDGINFQKASATLDGCVKIYSSRVDSAASEIGRLLNGLSTNETVSATDGEDDDDGEDGEIDLNAPARHRKSRITTNKETLVDFAAIRIKKMDFEVHIDPLFKKVLTDFDEGGSKSLLLNMLGVDENQKILFDTTDSASTMKENKRRNSILDNVEDAERDIDIDLEDNDDEHVIDANNDEVLDSEISTIDIVSLGDRFFGGEISFDDLRVCKSVAELQSVLNQEATPTAVLQILERANMKDYFTPSQNENPDDMGYDISFGGGGGGEIDNDIVAIENPNNSKYPGNRSSIFFDDLEDDTSHYGTTIRELFREDKSFTSIRENDDNEEEEFEGDATNVPDENLLAYFDQNLKNNWAGPDHWRVTKLKNMYNMKLRDVQSNDNSNENCEKQRQYKKREKSEAFVIDFLSEEYPDEDIIFEPSTNINLPKKDRESNDIHVLPVDMHYTVRYFIKLFQKDVLIKSVFKKANNHLDNVIDESLYAELNQANEVQPPANFNDPSFFHDNDGFDQSFGGDSGNQFDHYPENEHESSQQAETQATQLSGKFSQNGGISYSRVSKKVDIKLLKDNIWDTVHSEVRTRKSIVSQESSQTAKISDDNNCDKLKFSEIIKDVTTRYTPEAKKDLSTSFCFICLLHLANENGFTIENTTDHSDLIINSVES